MMIFLRYMGCIVTMLFFSSAAVAQEGDSSVPPEVKEKYEAGKTHFEAGEYEEAMTAFTDAYNLTGEPNLLFNLAACAERLGDAERAIAYYRVYLEEVPDAEDAEAVRERVTLLETEGIPAPEEESPPEPEPEPEPEKVETAPAPEVDPNEYYKPEEKKKRVIWPGLTIGLGAFVLGGGLTTAILANKEYSGLESSCKPDCTDDDIKTAKALAIASDVQFALGSAAVVAGVVGLVLMKKKEKAAAKTSVNIAPTAYPGGGLLVVEGRF